MKTSLKIALVLGAVCVVAGGGLALAQMEGPQPPDGPLQGLMRDHGRLADRLVGEFDLNHDGKVSHDEMNRTLGARFAAATHHAPLMTLEQFAALRQAGFRQHAAEMFRRLDWNGDGKLSLDEYAGPQRARFMAMDKDGSGAVACASEWTNRTTRKPGKGDNARKSFGSRGNFGLAGFCADNDLNKDGKVTRGELDSAIAKRFAFAANGAATMNASQFAGELDRRYSESIARTFKRLDRDNDGSLSLAEFASSDLKLFARLDRNRDGVITPDEMKPHARVRDERTEWREPASD